MDDKIFISRMRADQCLFQDFSLAKKRNQEVFVFYFFEATAKRLKKQSVEWKSALADTEKISNELSNFSFREQLGKAERPLILFAEHHPHLEIEQSVIRRLEDVCVGAQPEVLFFASLDEGFMQAFGTQAIVEMMRKLNIPEEEPVSSGMLTRSVINAQKKIAAFVQQEIPASSQDEWMQLNAPPRQ